MADSFITYDAHAPQPDSPGYFRRHVDQIFNFNGSDFENVGLSSHQSINPSIHGNPSRQSFDAFSHDSAYSTNPSTKHSPEYTPNNDDGVDDDRHKHSVVPPIIKKGIRKYYEPIVDGGVVYRYEDDPNEYRKARKRIQNRESATRVRNRKKTHVEVLEDEIQIHKQEKNDLKIQNSSLIAENTMLKQQIAFLESMIAKNNQDHVIELSESLQDGSRTDNSDSILHLMNNREEEQDLVNMQSHHTGMYRVAPTHNKVKKHMVMLGVFTLLLCVYGLLPRSEVGTVQLFSSSATTSLFSKPNSMAVGIKPSQRMPVDRQFDRRDRHKKHHWGRDGPHKPNRAFRDWLESQTKNDENKNESSSSFSSSSSYSSYLWVVELLVVMCYLVYLSFVGWTVYKNRSVKKEKKTAILHAV